jgi:glycerol-3-phosphate dehydrogenase
MSGADVDVVVIGGGLTGAAVLRDLARRGVKCVLFEKHDLAAAGTLAGLGTIDTQDLWLDPSSDPARRASREREAAILVATAPHLARVVPVIAVATEPRRGASLLARWDAELARRARTGEPVDRRALDAKAARALEPALVLEDDGGAVLTRRVRLDAHRLALARVRDALEQGAELRLREEVLAVTREGALVRVTTARGDTRARAVIVATGAWSMPASAAAKRERAVHLVLEHAFTTHAVVTADGSLVPFHEVAVVSGNAAPFDGAPEASRVSRDEVRALLATLGRSIPDLREARVDGAYASVRRCGAANEEPPIYVVPAGTPWDSRARAEAAVDRALKPLGIEAACDTATAKVPGGEAVEDSFVVAERLAVPEPTARRIVLRHGARALDLGARIAKRRTEASVVCACEPVLEAEIRHAVRVEHACDVSDVGRRTRLGHGPCGGMRCAHRAAEIIVGERALSPRDAHEMTRRFLVERWNARAPALDPTSLAQEELACARWASSSLAGEIDPGNAE